MMKFELNVVRFDAADVVTSSTCLDTTLPKPFGDALCDEVVQ